MYTGLTHIHGLVAGIVLILLLVITIFTAFNVGKTVSDKLRKLALFTMIFAHVQLLLGIVMYFMSPYFKGFLENPAESMRNPSLRIYVVEHPLTMIVVVILLTVAYSRIKKLFASQEKLTGFNFAYYLLALVLAFLMVPWKAWLG